MHPWNYLLLAVALLLGAMVVPHPSVAELANEEVSLKEMIQQSLQDQTRAPTNAPTFLPDCDGVGSLCKSVPTRYRVVLHCYCPEGTICQNEPGYGDRFCQNRQ